MYKVSCDFGSLNPVVKIFHTKAELTSFLLENISFVKNGMINDVEYINYIPVSYFLRDIDFYEKKG